MRQCIIAVVFDSILICLIAILSIVFLKIKKNSDETSDWFYKSARVYHIFPQLKLST